MYLNKSKSKKKKILIIILIIICSIFIIFYSLKSNRKMGIIEKGFRDIGTSIEKTLIYPFTALNADKDKDMSKSYLIQKNVNESLEKEIDELKKTLQLNKTLTEYKPVNATVLSRNKGYFYNTITIDKGSKDGIKDDMAAVTYNGLIGKTINTTYNSSQIKLLTSNDLNFKVSVSIMTNNGDSYAILNGYNKKDNTIKIIDVDKDADIKKGDKVLTSGLSSYFPGGIYIGEVEKIKSDKYNLSYTLYVKTKEDFNNIHYVTILKENK